MVRNVYGIHWKKRDVKFMTTDIFEDLTEVKDTGLLYIKIIKDTEFHKLGEIIDVEPRFGQTLIEEGIAEKVTFEDYKKEQLKSLKKIFLKSIEKKKKEDKQTSAIGLKIDNYLDNAREYYRSQPYIYDKNGIWWLWRNNRYEITDDVDLARDLDSKLGFFGQTISSGIRNNHLQAMMWVGRENDTKEAPVKWIQFKDEAFSLNSKNIYKVTKDYFFTNPIPWEMGESDETPIMDKLFEEWVGKEYVQSLYEVIAYCCYREYPIQTLVCLYGSGRNGKTCFIRLLGNFLGKENVCSTELDALLDSRFESFKLYRKLACFMGETNFGILDKSSILKKLTGSDMIGFEKKGKDPFNDYSYAKLIIASNSLPTSSDTSDGFYRRWFIIDFPNEFNEGRDVLKDIPEQEYKNLARKVIKLLPPLLQSGKFSNQGTIENRKDKYIMASNPLSIFLKNNYIRDINGYISYNELYTHYIQFLRVNKKRRVKSKEFKQALEDEGYWVEKTSKKILENSGYEGFKSGYWVEGISKVENCVNCATIPTSPIRKNNGVGNSAELAQNAKNQPFPPETKVEGVGFLMEWDPQMLVWQKCAIEGCNDSPCNLDSKGLPYCRRHWDNAI